ncbi:MAG: hypothetical protein ACXVHX_28160 [Solirubrobacteraceae bacterium]
MTSAVRMSVVGVCALTALAALTPSGAAAPGLQVTLRCPDHHPKVGRPWPIDITATRRGRGVSGRVRYEYLYQGNVVAHRSNYRFRGHFHDTLDWPASAVGLRLTFRAVVSTRYGTRRPSCWVQVRR